MSTVLRFSAAALVSALALTACRADTTTIEDRVWISEVPEGPRASFAAFFVTGDAARQVGVVHRGSMYDARHRVFAWKREDRRVRLEYLQDGGAVTTRVAPCDPPRGFDACIRFDGAGPGGVETWVSRKRWSVPRRNDGARVSGVDLHHALVTLAGEDEDLRALTAE